MENNSRKILIDADVISHFITGGEYKYLHLIFPKNKIYVLDKVHAELQRWPYQRPKIIVSEMISNNQIQLMDFPEDNIEILKEYTWIKKMHFKGDGESACLAVSRFNKQIIASSNLKDIKNYCNMHKIDYLTTMDFLCEALRNNLFTESRCNDFITKVLYSKSKLPAKEMKDYISRKIDFI